MYNFNWFDFSDLKYFFKRKGIGFNWVKVATGGSLEIFSFSESAFKSYHSTLP